VLISKLLEQAQRRLEVRLRFVKVVLLVRQLANLEECLSPAHRWQVSACQRCVQPFLPFVGVAVVLPELLQCRT
jgi:hypothetical protein